MIGRKLSLKLREKRMRSDIDSIPDYKPGKSAEDVKKEYGLQKVVKLASNENPYGTSPKVVEVLKNFNSFNTYPPKDSEELRERIAEYTGFEPEMIVVASGLDGVLETVFKMLIEPGDEVSFAIPTFPYYSILSKIYRAKEKKIGRDEDFRMATFSQNSKLTIVCSPNNPTGNVEEYEFVREIAESVDGYVFIDEAYAEFTEKKLTRLAENENVMVGRTFSKAFGLANLRLGYCIMHPSLRRAFMKVNMPFPVSSLAIKAGIVALEDREWMERCVKLIKRDREWFYKELRKISKPSKSEANFLYVETDVEARVIAKELEKRGIIVRELSGFEGASRYAFRVDVGKREDLIYFISNFKDVLCSQ